MGFGLALLYRGLPRLDLDDGGLLLVLCDLHLLRLHLDCRLLEHRLLLGQLLLQRRHLVTG